MILLQLFPLSFFQWCQQTAIGLYVQHSTWVFAVTETFHIICISILLGATLLIDLRLLGKGMIRESIMTLSHTVRPWIWSAFVGLVITGIVMFNSEAVKMSRNRGFFLKVVFLVLAVLFQLTIHRSVTSSNKAEGTGTAKLAASLSLCCWLGVALAGRSIAFF
jgi:hypothetical protein